jgi:hypothetical protein
LIGVHLRPLLFRVAAWRAIAGQRRKGDGVMRRAFALLLALAMVYLGFGCTAFGGGAYDWDRINGICATRYTAEQINQVVAMAEANERVGLTLHEELVALGEGCGKFQPDEAAVDFCLACAMTVADEVWAK